MTTFGAQRRVLQARIVFFAVTLNLAACKSSSESAATDPAACKTCVVLASGLCDPHGIAVQGTSVFWTEALCGSVLSVPASGGASNSLASGAIYGGNTKAMAIAVDATNVYWVDQSDGLVLKAPLGGGSLTTLASSPYPSGIAADAAYVYWAASGVSGVDAGGGPSGTIMRVPIGGGQPLMLASGLTAPSSLAVDSTYVYFANSASYYHLAYDGGSGPSYVSNHDGSVMKVPIGGGLPTTLASGQDPYGIALDATSVYWTNNAVDGTIMKVPLGGGVPAVLFSGQSVPKGIAVDATHIYWTAGIDSTGDGSVMMGPLDGGTPIRLASGQNGPLSLALDSTSVYWTDPGGDPINGGTVVKIAKP